MATPAARTLLYRITLRATAAAVLGTSRTRRSRGKIPGRESWLMLLLLSRPAGKHGRHARTSSVCLSGHVESKRWVKPVLRPRKKIRAPSRRWKTASMATSRNQMVYCIREGSSEWNHPRLAPRGSGVSRVTGSSHLQLA